EGGRATANEHVPVVSHADGSPLRADTSGGDLDVDGKANAELEPVAALTAPGLFGPELAIIRQLQQRVKCPLVLARVICRAARCRVREAIGRDQVAPTQLVRV